MSIHKHRLISIGAAAWLGMQVLGCARADIVLGTGADPFPHVAAGPSLPVADMVDAAGAGAASTPPSFAANGGMMRPPSAAFSGMRGQPPPASTAVPVRPGGDTDAGPPRPSARRSSGCGKDPAQAAAVVDGQPASFLLDIPASYNKTRPYSVVLAFRDMDSSADAFRSQLNLAAIADAIIIYPDPLDIARQFPGDVTLPDELLSQLGQGYCLDLDRVFALGDGTGALFANLLGCMRGDQIRAIAMLSGAPPPPPGPCVGGMAVWLLQRSDADPMTVGSGLGNRDYWARANACDLRATAPVSPSPCVEYRGCRPGQPVRFCEYRGAAWPSFAVSGAWEFFESF